ncbi:hypothetical protein DXG01_006958 [Tephrocybe rancida]|nr:hypothetical protein DXG01_006958 [Tephrocybe rancida]
MRLLSLTLVFLSSCFLVNAGTLNAGDDCNQGENRLQAGTYQFWDECNSQTYCSSAGKCVQKGCRKDDFPFGYAPDDKLPEKCPKGKFCPDEEDQCQDILPVNSGCQLNRDDQCEAPPNFKELADTTGRGLNVNGSVCLNSVCLWANKTLGVNCTVENTAYIAYGVDSEFIDIVSRGDCHLGLYCDAAQRVCMNEKALGEACTADKEKQRDEEREKRLQYWREQNAFHQNLLQMRETARASILSLPGNGNSARSTMYSRDGAFTDDAQAPILQHAVPKASGLRHYLADDGSSEPSVDTITPSSPSPPTPPPTPPLTLSEHTSLTKGKQKEVDLGYDDFRDPEPVLPQETAAYPPTNDDASETRRIEENLRRWDVAERQRRKYARESVQPPSSLVGDVSRTASLLWSSRHPRHKHDASLGNHVALQSQENINSVPLDDLTAATPTPSPSPSPSPSPQRRDSDPQNPFANPLSPFADPLQSMSSPSTNNNSPSSSALLVNQSPDASVPTSRGPPGPPLPLDLPPPRTPPIKSAPSPAPTPSLSRPADDIRDEIRETRWWHDWLCGCSEGPDRGGEYQAGRTNPFE